jgi:hypothetical protein
MQVEELFTSLAKQAKDEKKAVEREERRLKLEPFKTNVAPMHEDTVNALKGWRPPADGGAYILFEKKQWNLTGEGSGEWGGGLMTLSVEARPEQTSKIDEYTTYPKNFRVLHWGNFPKLNDPNPERAKKARIYSGPNGSNPWDQLERHLFSKIKDREVQSAEVQGKISAMSEEIALKDKQVNDLEGRIEAMKRELEEAKAKDKEKAEKKGGKNEQNQN